MSHTPAPISKTPTPPQTPLAQPNQPESSSNNLTYPAQQPATPNIPVTAPDIISQATRGSAPNHDGIMQIYGGSVGLKEPSKNRTLITSNTPITLNDKQRLERMKQIVGALKDKLTIYQTDKSGLTEIISRLKQLSWLSMEISSHTKYTDSPVSQNISTGTWTVLNTLARGLNTYTNKQFSKWLTVHLDGLIQTDISSLEQVFLQINQSKKTGHKATLSHLSTLTLPLTDQDYLAEAIQRLRIAQTFEHIDTSNAFFVLRAIEVVGETFNHLSIEKKSRLEAKTVVSIVLLRNRIQHPEEGGDQCIELIQNLFTNKDGILTCIKEELVQLIPIFEALLSNLSISNSFGFDVITNYSEKIQAAMQAPPIISTTSTNSQLDGINKIIQLIEENSQFAARNKLYEFLSKKVSLTEDVFNDLLRKLGITVSNNEIYTTVTQTDKLAFQEKFVLLKSFPPEFKRYVVFNEFKSFFEANSKKTFPTQEEVIDFLKVLQLSPEIQDLGAREYEELKTWANSKQLDAAKAEKLCPNFSVKNKNGMANSSECSSYLKQHFKSLITNFKQPPIIKDDQIIFVSEVNKHLKNIAQWSKQSQHTQNQAKASASLQALKTLSINIPQTLEEIQNSSDLFRLPGYGLFYLKNFQHTSTVDFTIDRLLAVLEESQIDLSNYTITKPFFDAYRTIHKLSDLETTIQDLRSQLIQFRHFAQNLSSLENDTVATLQCEYFIEGIARYAEALLEQPESHSSTIGTTLMRTELQALKDFRNGLAHRPHATNPHDLSYMLNSTLLYMMSDLEAHLNNLQTHTFSFIPAPTPPVLSTVGELRSFIYGHRKTIIELLIQAGAISRSWSILGHAVGCNIGPQKFLTLSVEFAYYMTELDLLLLEAEFRQKLGIHVMVVDQDDKERLYRNLHLSDKEIVDLLELKQDFGHYIEAGCHVELYRKNKATLFDFGDGQTMRIANSTDEASIAINAIYPSTYKKEVGLELGDRTIYEGLNKEAERGLIDKGYSPQHPLFVKTSDSLFWKEPKPSTQSIESYEKNASLELNKFNLIDAVYFLYQETEVSLLENSQTAIHETSYRVKMKDLYNEFYGMIIDIAARQFRLKSIQHHIDKKLKYLKSQYNNSIDINWDLSLENLILSLSNDSSNDKILSDFVKELSELNESVQDCTKKIDEWQNPPTNTELGIARNELYNRIKKILTTELFFQPTFFQYLVTQLSQNSSINQDTFINDTVPHLYQQLHSLIREKLIQDVMAKAEQLIQNEELYLFSTSIVTVPKYVYSEENT